MRCSTSGHCVCYLPRAKQEANEQSSSRYSQCAWCEDVHVFSPLHVCRLLQSRRRLQGSSSRAHTRVDRVQRPRRHQRQRRRKLCCTWASSTSCRCEKCGRHWGRQAVLAISSCPCASSPFAQCTFLVTLHRTTGLWPLSKPPLTHSLHCTPAHSNSLPILLCTSPKTTTRASCKLYGQLHRTPAHLHHLPTLLCTSPRTTTRASCLSAASRASFTTVMPSAWRRPSSTRSASSIS